MQNNKLRTIVVSPAGALPVRWRGARWPLLFLALSRPVTLALPLTSFFLAISMTLSETPTWTVEAAASPDGAEPRARRPRPRLGHGPHGHGAGVTHHTPHRQNDPRARAGPHLNRLALLQQQIQGVHISEMCFNFEKFEKYITL